MSILHKTDQHARTCRALGYALTLEDDPFAWAGLSTVLRVRLTGFERSCVLMSVVASMHADDVAYVLEQVRERQGVGMPLPPLFSPEDEATWWAEHASTEERNAVLVAAFLSLPLRERDVFLASASRRDAA